MKINKLIPAAVMGTVVLLASCEKDIYNGVDSTVNSVYTDTTGPLKAAADFPIGIATDYTALKDNAAYRNVVFREADATTFGYHMKHGAIVQSDGSLNFSRADELMAICNQNNIEVFGHTLAWHQNQNGDYLRTLTGTSVPVNVPNLIANGSFELGSGNEFTNWGKYNGGSMMTATTAAGETYAGSRALKVVNTADNPGGQWRVQLASDLFNTTVNTAYRVTYWVKAANAGGSIRLSTGPTAQYQGDQTISTTWSQITYTFTAKEAQSRILFDMGLKANTYYIDDVMIVDASAPTSTPVSNTEIATKVDNALKTFIQGTVNHFKDKVHAWDVVNEPINDNGTLRASATSSGDTFYWGQFLGKDFIKKAFTYASQSDPTAQLFINDYNLEAFSVKVDSLVAIVKWLQAANVPIHGIGTQMHCSTATSYAKIDDMFKKLAATGLKVRISELDVRLNPNEKVIDVNASTAMLNLQAAMYYYVVKSYLKHVPAAQRAGITIWGVEDKNSWILVNQKKNDAPLLFNNNFGKKPAYAAVLEALKGK